VIYVIVALKPEAQAFVDKFKLPKTKQNRKITIVVSGVGTENMFKATKDTVTKMNDDDKIVNVGICGANKSFKIGQLIDGFEEDITCVESAISDKNIYAIVDMESNGFLEATKTIQNRYMFKIVSDHFEPQSVTKEGTKQLIFKNIDEIMKRIED